MSEKGIDITEESSDYQRGKNHLLVIAINAYQHCPKLYNCVKDAQDLIEVLTEKYHFESENITTLFDGEATEDNIYETFEKLAISIQSPDNLLIYFSGHGEYNQNLKQGYWIPVDAQIGKQSQYMPNSEILSFLRAVNAHHIFLISDSCFSGSLFSSGASRSVIKRYERDPSRWGLTSGRNEIVYDGTPGDNSPFAESLLYRLKTSTEALSVQQLCAHVVEHVLSNANQTPIGEPLRVGGHKNGQFVFHPKMMTPVVESGIKKEHLNEVIPPIPSPQPIKKQSWLVKNILWLAIPVLLILGFLVARPLLKKTKKPELQAYEAAWQKAKSTNTIEAYRRYAQQFPASVYARKAKELEKALRNSNSQTTNTNDIPRNLIAVVGNLGNGGSISKRDLLTNASLKAIIPNCSENCNGIIAGFTAISIGKRGIKAIYNKGYLFNPQLVNRIESAPIDEWIIFTEVKAKAPGETVAIKLNDVAFQIANNSVITSNSYANTSINRRYTGRKIRNNIFQSFNMIEARKVNCKSDCTCKVERFYLSRHNKKGDAQSVLGSANTFDNNIRRMITKAQAGDFYIFHNIKTNCGNTVISPLVFMVQ